MVFQVKTLCTAYHDLLWLQKLALKAQKKRCDVKSLWVSWVRGHHQSGKS